jgi:hypothetical protein
MDLLAMLTLFLISPRKKIPLASKNKDVINVFCAPLSCGRLGRETNISD